MSPVLELRNLRKSFDMGGSFGRFFGGATEQLVAVDDVSLSVHPRKVLGLVGESGSGKSTCGLMAMRLLDVSSGQILVNGTDITRLAPAELKPLRKQMQIVFQDSYSSLDPMMTLSQIVAEPFVIHGMYTPSERSEVVADLFEKVGLDRSYRSRYPHELSGGQRQRISIARALALKPNILVADEPTSALDVSVKAQVINLLHDLQDEMGLSILFISHELNVIRSLADEIAVMHRGRIVEQASTEAIFQNAQHPYTKSLLSAIPSLNPRERIRRTFMSAEEIYANIPTVSRADVKVGADSQVEGPQLVNIADDHKVEVFVEG
jgi:oligopeptide/dipeptide ABC transporter ATP-binding protein